MPTNRNQDSKLPDVFIGSTSASLQIARSIAEGLRGAALAIVWDEQTIRPSNTIIEGLMEQVRHVDFAIFVFSPDLIAPGDSEQKVADNVLFECGLFMGQLGRERTFIVCDEHTRLKLPSDLGGVVVVEYDGAIAAKNLPQAVRNACNVLVNAIQRTESVQPRRTSSDAARRVKKVLERGSSRFLHAIVDGALYTADTEETFHQGLKKALISSGILPTKYLYCTDDGCELWLKICRTPEYVFNTNSFKLLENVVGDVAEAIKRKSGRSDVDLISLGSGNGAKDGLILRRLTADIDPPNRVYYYPVDVNAQMLVQAVKGAMNPVDPSKVAVKAIVADFTEIHELIPIYEDRPNANVFSVLGNTLGNSDESKILDSVQKAMQTGDFLLLEVNTGPAELDDFLSLELNMRHDFVPLQSMGVPFDKSKLRYRREHNASVVGGKTVSTLAVYDEATIDGVRYREIKLGVIHHYDTEELLDHLKKQRGLTCVHRSDGRGVGLFLLMREQ